MNTAHPEEASARTATSGPRASHAFVVLSLSFAAVLLFMLVMITPSGGEEGDDRLLLLAYSLPIAVPFVAFILDRLERWQNMDRRAIFIEAPVLILALLRAFVNVPFVSGHSIFLTYALLTSTSLIARVTTVLVLCEVIYIKIFIWHDPTLLGGMLVGIIGGMAFRAVPARKHVPS